MNLAGIYRVLARNPCLLALSAITVRRGAVGIPDTSMKGATMFLGSPQEDAALQSPSADNQVETLIEDISIDGMCGVY